MDGLRDTKPIRAVATFGVAAVPTLQMVDGRKDDLVAFFVEVDALDQLLELGHCFGQTLTLAHQSTR